jgi:glycosyltransferase involved in cell wall biosynthesis
MSELRVLVMEPYHGGSHRAFLRSVMGLPFRFTLMDLPARKWKWRMRLAAPHFARLLRESGQRFDRILCSTFLDVASFRGLAPAWVRDVPVLTYFHENQFEYPVQVDDERDFHFALTNMTTALASDSLAFNSRYNLDSFLAGTGLLLRHATDMALADPASAIRAKSRVLPPGADFSLIDRACEIPTAPPPGPPVVLWNHRWEHDKGPETFFNALYRLDEQGVEFRLIVLGESFERRPGIFDEARERLAYRTLHFGYADSREEYARLLALGDVAVSTAQHEFFGIAVTEAVRAGCRPLLPRRLSYPELFGEDALYHDDASLVPALKAALAAGRIGHAEGRRLTDAYSWAALAPEFEQWIAG